MPWLPHLLISVFVSFTAFLWKGEEGRFQAGDHRGAIDTVYLRSKWPVRHVIATHLCYTIIVPLNHRLRKSVSGVGRCISGEIELLHAKQNQILSLHVVQASTAYT